MRPAALLRPLLAALLVWVLTLLTAAQVSAETKSYRIPNVAVQATILPDGSMQVVEQRTFAFSGTWSWWEQWFPLDPDQRMEDIRLSVNGKSYLLDPSGTPGTYTVTHEPAKTALKWHFQATDTTITTEIRYRLINAVTVHNDTAELYRSFIGRNWEVETGQAAVTLQLPPGADKAAIRAWGHGSLQGTVAIDSGSQVTWKVDRLPPMTFLEGRVSFPPALVPQGTRRSGEDALDAILAEEMAWAEQANRERRKAQIDLGLAVLGGLTVAYLLWRRFGTNRGSFTGPYYRELPSDHTPAEVGVLFRGRSDLPELKATLLDLARRQYIALEPASHPAGRGPGDFIIRWTGRHDASSLKAYEQRLLGFLFSTVAGGQPELALSALPAYSRMQPHAASSFFASWQAEVDQAARDCGFWEPGAKGAGCLLPLGLVACAIGAVFAGLTVTAGVLMLAALPAGVISLAPSRTRLGEDELSKWKAFQRFLTHFSRLDLAHVPAVVLWEHYLVYATVLGVAKQVLREMRTALPRLPEEQRNGWDRGSLPWDPTGGAPMSLDQFDRALDQSLGPFSKATSAHSDGGGRGGGFSAGGGGGSGTDGGGRGG